MKNFKPFGLLSLFLSSWCLAIEPPINVLFIGNSLTYGNSMPLMLEAMVNEGKSEKKIHVEMVTIGGATLKQHWSDGRALAAINRGGWDYVVLQEHSTLGPSFVNGEARISHPQTFRTYVTLFNGAIHRIKARTLLYLTWADEDKTEDQIILNNAFVDIANDIGADVIPVGPVWQILNKKSLDLNLYLEDKLHPSEAGSYVAASVFYAHLFGRDVIGKPASIVAQRFDNTGEVRSEEESSLVELSTEQAKAIQAMALASVKTMPAFVKQVKSNSVLPQSLPELPSALEGPMDIAGEWTGKLLFYRDAPAVMTLKISRIKDHWRADQTIVFENGDRVQASRELWVEDGQITWVDTISDSYFVGVYRGNSIVGQARSFRLGYLEPGGRFGEWELNRQ